MERVEKAKAIVNRRDRSWSLSFKLISDNNTCDLHDRIDIKGIDLNQIADKIVDVIEENGLIVYLSFNGKFFVPDPARSPYNFVELNHKIIEGQDLPSFTSFYNDRISGQINVNIETKTPLFIRGNNDSEHFFKIGTGKPIIPGSSLRGMTRTLVEVASWSKMEFVDKDKVFMHRSMADPSKELQDTYKQERPAITGSKEDELVGLLTYTDGNFFIMPTSCLGDCKRKPVSDILYQFDEFGNNWIVHPGRAPNNNKAWIISTVPNGNAEGLQVPRKVVNSYLADDNRPKDDKKRINVDILAFARNHKRFKTFMEKSTISEKIIQKGVPVFYNVDENEMVTSIGHTRNYRIPYAHSISFHINQAPLSDNKLDISTTIFGDTNNVSSRVFFFDSNLIKEGEYEPRARTKHLLNPKPTTFQHYLKQDYGIGTQKKELKNWGSNDTQIRGNKFYYHRKTSSKPEDPNSWISSLEPDTTDRRGTTQTPIIALKNGWVFGATIRFENLTKEELGALLFVLQLPEGCYHKMGMGKPLGLGSIAITVDKLTLIGRQKRYKTLFDKNGKWEEADENKTTEIVNYQKDFEKYILGELPEDEKKTRTGDIANSLWETTRLLELKTLLQFDHNLSGANVDWLHRTRYMEIEHPINKNEYKFRPVLPKPTEVVKKDTYQKK